MNEREHVATTLPQTMARLRAPTPAAVAGHGDSESFVRAVRESQHRRGWPDPDVVPGDLLHLAASAQAAGIDVALLADAARTVLERASERPHRLTAYLRVSLPAAVRELADDRLGQEILADYTGLGSLGDREREVELRRRQEDLGRRQLAARKQAAAAARWASTVSRGG